MSETMSPHVTPSYENTSAMQESSTRRYIFGGRTSDTQTTIPSFIKFPKDIFQDLKPLSHLNRFLNNGTIRPYTVRTRITATNFPETTTDIIKLQTIPTTSATTQFRTTTPSTTTTTITTTTTTVKPKTIPTRRTTTRKIYTIRPNRGQSKWKIAKSVKSSDKQNLLELDEKQANR